MRNEDTAAHINTLVRFCARRDIESVTTADREVDVAILFGGSILAGAEVFGEIVRSGIAAFTMIVGGRGHSTDALQAAILAHTEWRDVDDLSEAALFQRYLRENEAVSVDALEEESTNCGTNVTNALALLDARGVRRERLLLVQDATMQQRMDAGFRRYVPATTTLINFASHRTTVDSSLGYISAPVGMWDLDRYVTMLLGEVRRLTDDADGYGPAGRDYIAHVDVPSEVTAAAHALRETYAERIADPRWASSAR